MMLNFAVVIHRGGSIRTDVGAGDQHCKVYLCRSVGQILNRHLGHASLLSCWKSLVDVTILTSLRRNVPFTRALPPPVGSSVLISLARMLNNLASPLLLIILLVTYFSGTRF